MRNSLITMSAEYIGFFVAFMANFVLIFLILSKTNQNLGAYKYLMLCFAIWSLLYSFTDFMTQPSMHTYKNAFIVICASWFKYNSSAGPIIIATWSTSFGLTVVLLAIHFIYRYIAISRSENLYYFQWPMCFIWPILFFGVMIFWWCDVYFLLYSNDEVMNDYMRDSINATYQDDIEKLSYIGPIYYEWDLNGTIIIDWSCCIALLNIYLIAIATLLIIVTLGFKINREMRSMKRVAKKTRELQKQLFYALMIQTIVPIVFMYLPATIFFLSPLVGIELGSIANMTSICLALYPALDPMVVMFIITDYRRFMLQRVCGCTETSNTTSRVSTTTFTVV